MSENTEIMKNSSTAMAGYDPNVAYGFEETESKDIIIPRIKVVQALSPERQDGEASEGDIMRPNEVYLQSRLWVP